MCHFESLTLHCVKVSTDKHSVQRLLDCSSVRNVNHKPDVSFSAYVNDNIKLQKLREDLKWM